MTDQANSSTPAADPETGLPVGAAPSAEYVEQMRNVQHGDPTPAPLVPHSKTPRPDHVPEKFWDPVKGEARWDDLAKSYAELEKSRGKPAEEAPPTEAPADGPPVDANGKIEKKEGEANPLSTAVQTLAESYAANGGQVDEAQVQALEALGVPKATIDNYFAGLQALQTLAMQDIHAAAGGKDSFDAAVTWAAESLSDQDLAYYNDNIDDPAKRTQTVEWLMAKHRTARPSEGKLVPGAAPSAINGDVFRSQTEITDAMADPRYARDEGYRKSVADKLLRSKQSGSISVGAEFHRRSR